MLSDKFVNRHNGPRDHELPVMLKTIGVSSLDSLIEKTVPCAIRLEKPLNVPAPMTEFEYLNHIKALGQKNKLFRSFIGQGYYGVAVEPCFDSTGSVSRGIATMWPPYDAAASRTAMNAARASAGA